MERFRDTISLNNKLNSLAKQHTIEGANTALQILKEAEEWYSITSTNKAIKGMNGPIPDKYSYTTVIDAFSKQGLWKEALDLLHEMDEKSASNPERCIRPNTITYNSVINSFAVQHQSWNKSYNDKNHLYNSVNYGEQAEILLRKMLKEYEEGMNMDAWVDTTTYNTVIKVWSSSGRTDAGENAQRLLNEMWAMVMEKGKDAVIPDQFTYSSVMSAWARSGLGQEGGERSESLLEEMEHYRKQGYAGPSTYCCNAVLNAWAKSKSDFALERAQAIIHRMETLCFNRPELTPNVISYNTIIALHAKNGDADGAEAILRRMQSLSQDPETKDIYASCAPDLISYNSVIAAWSKRRTAKAAGKAERILRGMEQRYARGLSNFLPDACTYSSAISAWAQSGDEKGPERAEKVLNMMINAYRNGNLDRMPTSCFNAVCNAYAKSKEYTSASDALSILEQMEHLNVHPDIYTYTTIIDALAKQGTEESATRALSLLRDIEHLYSETKDPSLKPNKKTFTSVITAISRSKKDPMRAEEILNEMEAKKYDVADVVCYNALLNAWAWSSNEKEKANRVDDIFQNMIQRSIVNEECKPDVVTLNSILNACAFTETGDETISSNAVKIAVKAYELFQDESSTFGPPNHVSYGLMLMVFNKLLLPGTLRTDLMKNIFYQCCQAGCLSGFVATQLQLGVSIMDLKELFGNAVIIDKTKNIRIDKRKVPKEWSDRFHNSKDIKK
jgi:pentatricopeptide repeat protein